MKIVILTLGTRGDVQPYVALGQGLQRAGHLVTLVTARRFQHFIIEHGVGFAPLSADYLDLVDSPEAKAALRGSPIKALTLLRRQVLPNLRRVLDEAWVASQDADAVIYHPKALAGPHIAAKLRVPGFLTLPVPALTPTRAFPNPLLPLPHLGGALNLLSYAVTPLSMVPYRGLVNTWRRERLGLPPHSLFASDLGQGGRLVPTLYPCSPQVVLPPDDWPLSTAMTGYWFLDQQPEWEPLPALLDFLAAGPPPVYVGFGSMASPDPQRLTRVVVAALGRARLRGILATGTGGLSPAELPPSIFAIEQAPHEWLFPRVAAVVHHGGAGTTASGLRAGKPTLICPVFGDQPFWGRRVHQLGVGPKPILQKRLRAESLAAALHQATTDPAIRQGAAALGEKIRREDGVARAIRIIEQGIGVHTRD